MSKLPAEYRHDFSKILPADLIEVLLDYQNLVEKLAELENEKAVKKVANLFSSVLLVEENASLLNDELPTKEQLLELVEMNDKNELSSTATKEVFLKFFDPEMHFKDTRSIAKELGVIQENDMGALEAIVDAVLAKLETKQSTG